MATSDTRTDAHHRVPRCLLRLRDRAEAHTELDGEGLALWMDYELEALHFGVDPDVSREELAALVEGSTVEIPREEHRNGHASDFARWGRRRGTLRSPSLGRSSSCCSPMAECRRGAGGPWHGASLRWGLC